MFGSLSIAFEYWNTSYCRFKVLTGSKYAAIALLGLLAFESPGYAQSGEYYVDAAELSKFEYTIIDAALAKLGEFTLETKSFRGSKDPNEFSRRRENEKLIASYNERLTQLNKYSSFTISFKNVPTKINGEYKFDAREFLVLFPGVLEVDLASSNPLLVNAKNHHIKINLHEGIIGGLAYSDVRLHKNFDLWNGGPANKVVPGNLLALPMDDLTKAEAFAAQFAEVYEPRINEQLMYLHFNCTMISRHVCTAWNILLTSDEIAADEVAPGGLSPDNDSVIAYITYNGNEGWKYDLK